MGMLDDIMASDMDAFLDVDGFAEEVVYTPYGGSPRNIHAIVERDPPERLGQALRPKMIITVANDSVRGIRSGELDTGGATVRVAYRLGDTAAAYQVKRSQDAGSEDSAMLRLELH